MRRLVLLDLLYFTKLPRHPSFDPRRHDWLRAGHTQAGSPAPSPRAGAAAPRVCPLSMRLDHCGGALAGGWLGAPLKVPKPPRTLPPMPVDESTPPTHARPWPTPCRSAETADEPEPISALHAPREASVGVDVAPGVLGCAVLAGWPSPARNRFEWRGGVCARRG